MSGGRGQRYRPRKRHVASSPSARLRARSRVCKRNGARRCGDGSDRWSSVAWSSADGRLADGDGCCGVGGPLGCEVASTPPRRPVGGRSREARAGAVDPAVLRRATARPASFDASRSRRLPDWLDAKLKSHSGRESRAMARLSSNPSALRCVTMQGREWAEKLEGTMLPTVVGCPRGGLAICPVMRQGP